jgi:hypothetical protein
VDMIPDNSNTLNDCKQQCAICLDCFLEGDLVSISSVNVKCRHQFHHQCIMEWCMKQSDCPCCRRDLLFLQDVTTVVIMEAPFDALLVYSVKILRSTSHPFASHLIMQRCSCCFDSRPSLFRKTARLA